MPPNNQQKKSTEQLLQVIAGLDSVLKNTVTPEDMAKVFNAVLEGVKKVEARIAENVAKNKDGLDSELSAVKKDIKDIEASLNQSLRELGSKNGESLGSAIRQLREEVKQVQDMIPTIPDLTDRFEELEGKIPEPLEELPIEQQRTYTRDLLEGIQEEEEKLAISAIAHLEERLDELFKRPVGTGGGGFNYGALDLHILDDITPTGDIDGNNTVFLLPHSPSPVSSLKVYRGGSRQRITEDYTFSGSTITFNIAPQVGEIILCDLRI
jgi:gas vesicle protein